MIRNILALCVATLFGGISSQALAQAYPNKPIKIIVPAGPGDSCDILTRLIAPKLTERLGQPIVVDNRAGSAGQLGLTLLKQSAPDGYTLGCGQGGNMVIVPLAYAKVAYDSRKDFTPMAMMASNFVALVVSPKTPFKTVKELIDYGKANPGKLTFGTNGEGAFLHFATERLRMMAGFDYMHVPYRDMNAVFTQMLGGDIDASVGSFVRFNLWPIRANCACWVLHAPHVHPTTPTCPPLLKQYLALHRVAGLASLALQACLRKLLRCLTKKSIGLCNNPMCAIA